MLQQSSLQISSQTEAGMRDHVVALLPRGETIRNFVYTGALDEVAQSAKVSVVSVIPSPEIETLLKSRYTDVYQLQEIAEDWRVKFPRELLDMAHGRWLWSAAAQDRWRLRDLEANTNARRIRRLTKKLACFPFANRPGLNVLSRIEQWSSSLFSTCEDYFELFRNIKPSLVFNGSHVHGAVAAPAVRAAHRLGIPTATFIFSWDNLTSQGRIMAPYDFYLVWNEKIRMQLLDIYDSVKPEQVFVTGTPQFDFHFKPEMFWTREEFCRHVGADANRPIVLYSTGMANHMPAEPRTVESIADRLASMTDLGKPQLLVRVYPKDRTGRFEALKQKRPDILFPEIPWEPAWLTPKLEDSYLLTNMLRHAAVGINVASTVSLEMCMFDKPVINVAYNPPGEDTGYIDYHRYYSFDHYRPLVESGAVALARSEDELERMLRTALTEPQAGSSERRALIKFMFGNSLDGFGGARVAQCLLTLASARSNGPIR